MKVKSKGRNEIKKNIRNRYTKRSFYDKENEDKGEKEEKKIDLLKNWITITRVKSTLQIDFTINKDHWLNWRPFNLK